MVNVNEFIGVRRMSRLCKRWTDSVGEILVQECMGGFGYLGALCPGVNPDLNEMPWRASHLCYGLDRALNFARRRRDERGRGDKDLSGS